MTVLTENAEDIRRNFGYTATFTPAVGDAVSLSVEYQEYTDIQPTGYDSSVPVTRRTITYLKADLSAEPNVDETFTISGTAYKVKTIEESDPWFQTVGVV